MRIAKKMKAFDALDVGAHLVWPRPFFSVMQKLLEVSPLASLVDAMQELCTQGRHKAMSTGKLKWYSDLTISSLGAEPRPNSAIKREWREHCLQMLSEVQTHTHKPNNPFFPICGDPISPICQESNSFVLF